MAVVRQQQEELPTQDNTQNRARRKRQYEPLWEALKETRQVEIVLQPDGLTERQLKKQTGTIRKAVSKEKYIDEAFKLNFPFAEITSTRKDRTITFILELNSANPFTDF